ncbi:NTP transferase domain-containing protein [Patescibacteria group bacterium]|nr:NTP transferase domain-containing protein [Patescibacteria group bacterium]
MKTKIIILAAGKGTRMGSELPKALVPLQGKAMISHLIESVVASAVDECPVVVVSPDNKEIISQTLSRYNCDYAIQEQQLGSGHAVACARNYIPADTDNVIVLYCDHPFVTADSISKFGLFNTEAVTIMPTELGDYNDWHQNFFHWGRIVRDKNNEVEKIVEFKDSSAEEINITEVNPGFMCFNNQWLWKNIDKLSNDNGPKEYYLTALVEIAFKQGYKVGTINIEPQEAMGINSREELAIAESLINQ